MQMVSSREAHHVVLYVAVVLLVVLFMLVYRSYVQCGSKSAAMCTDHTNNEALDPHDLASGHCKGLQMEVNPNSNWIRGFYSARQCYVWSVLDMCLLHGRRLYLELWTQSRNIVMVITDHLHNHSAWSLSQGIGDGYGESINRPYYLR